MPSLLSSSPLLQCLFLLGPCASVLSMEFFELPRKDHTGICKSKSKMTSMLLCHLEAQYGSSSVFRMLTSSSKVITRSPYGGMHIVVHSLITTHTTSNMTMFFMSVCVLVPLGVCTLVSCDILQVCHSHFSKHRRLNRCFSCQWSGILMLCIFNVYLSPGNVTTVYL